MKLTLPKKNDKWKINNATEIIQNINKNTITVDWLGNILNLPITYCYNYMINNCWKKI